MREGWFEALRQLDSALVQMKPGQDLEVSLPY